MAVFRTGLELPGREIEFTCNVQYMSVLIMLNGVILRVCTM